MNNYFTKENYITGDTWLFIGSHQRFLPGQSCDDCNKEREPIDITGWTVSVGFKKTANSAVCEYRKDVTEFAEPLLGKYVIEFTPEETALFRTGEYIAVLQVYDASGRKSEYFNEPVIFTQGIV